jgi:RHS repeat-associated protein
MISNLGVGMRSGLRSLLRCLVCVLAALAAVSSPSAFAEGSPVLGGTGGSSLESPLVVPEAQSLVGGQGVSEAEEARRTSPEAAVSRQESQTKYEGMNAEEAAKLAASVFPAVVDHSAGGLPQLPEGQHIATFTSADTAQIDLGEGGRAVLDSTMPIATESASGQWSPVNLSVSEASGSFRIANPVVGVDIPKRLQDGVSLSGTDVSLTPVADGSGVAVSGSEGQVDGSVVFYGGVGAGSDVDELVKPETNGFSEDAILRSAASPEHLFYRVGLPEGASLVEADDGSGDVSVMDGGSVIADISVPSVEDAAGVSVPTSVSVQGDQIVLSVDKGTESVQYPVLVDPEVKDSWLFKENGHTTNWHFVSNGTKITGLSDRPSYWKLNAEGNHTESEWGALEYTTQGESYITALETTSGEAKNTKAARVEDEMLIVSAKGVEEGKKTLPEGKFVESVTAKGSAGNSTEYLMTSVHAGEGTEGELLIKDANVTIAQAKGPEISADTSHETVDGGKRNIFYGSGGWLGPNSDSGFELHAKDPGVGVSYFHLSAGLGESFFTETDNYIENNECTGGVQCLSEVNKGYGYESQMPNGEDSLEAYVKNGMGSEAHLTTQKIKVDNEPPYNITLSELPSNHEIRDGQHILLKASATDGKSPTPSSGMASILLDVDGQPISGPQGGCSKGPCTGNAEWTLNAENYAAGEHTLTVVATDNAGNVADSEEYHLIVHHAENVTVGPGLINPVTGELSLAATDVSVGVPGGTLTVSRSYRSRHLAQGTEGPLGPQWNLSLGAQQSLLRVSGGMILTGGNGEQVVFESQGNGKFTSPTGDAGLVLLEKTVESKTVFTLSENGSVTTFEIPSGGSGVWMPSSVEGPSGTNTTLYKFKVEGGVIEPKEELAPVPAGVSCGKEISELKEGCRALKLEYATETKAKGEKAGEWGEFAGHLSKVKYIAWNASKTKTESVVAEYAYDVKGRLRAEWNPQVAPSPLKTTYGYDTEGHVTAVSTAGHEPALLEQGTIPSDAGPGRLLAVAVPSAATALGTGEAPVNTEAPTLSSTKPAVGTEISVTLTSEKTPGKWSASPLAFIYQWEDCNSSGKECSPIPGAVNQAYYPVAGDEGHTLVAEAIALNATGAVTASSATTSTVASGTPNTPLPEPPAVGSDAVTTLEYQVPVSGSGAPYEMSSTEAAKWGQTDDPSEAMAIFPPDKVMGWPAKEYKHETVYYLDGKDRTVNTALPTGGISVTEYNLYNDVVRTLSPDNRLKAITEGCKANEECKSATESAYEEKGTEPGTELLSTLGPVHTVKLAVGKEGKANEEAQARERTNYYYNEGAPSEGGPYHLVTKTIDSAETSSKEEFDRRTTTTSYSGQEGLGWKLRKPTSVTTDPSGLNLVHTTEYNASTGNVIKTTKPAASGKDAKVPPTYAAQFGSAGTGDGQFNGPTDVATDANGNIWVNDREDARIEKFSSSGTFIQAMGFGVNKGEGKYEICTTACKEGIAGSGKGQFEKPSGVSVNQTTGNVYVTDNGNSRIEEFSSSGTFIRTFGSAGAGAEELSSPTQTTIDSSGDLWVVDYGNSRLAEFSSEGKFILAVGWGVSDGKNEAEICTTTCETGIAGSGNGQFFDPQSVAISEGNVYVVDRGNNRVQEFSSSGKYLSKFGTKGTGNGEFSAPFGIATNPANSDLYVTDKENDRVEEFTPSGSFVLTFGSAGSGSGQLTSPKGAAVNSSGEIYVVDSTNDRVEKWVPTITGNEGSHDTKTIYYTAAANSEYKECGEHPAMANLPCETAPAAQPGTTGLSELPITKYTYNIWDEPETTTETVGSTTRTKADVYDGAGRLKTAAISSTVGTTMPTITDEYNKETGALEKQCANEGKACTEGKPKTITNVLNKLGELESYTDAGENTSTYEYDVDGRVKKVNDGKGTEAFTYSETTGLITELAYENGTTKLPFTGTYDVEGNLLTEGYPNGMTATYTYNQVGKPTTLEYKKTTHCTEKCVWFSDSVIPSIHGQWIEQTSTLSHQVYSYDNAGRLTQVQNTPAGKGCTTRIYAYDEDTNRTSLTTREPGTEGKCATEGGKVQEHTYDTADRLTDPGIAYNTFGDITTLPASDAEESAEHELTNTYYTDSQVASQKQNEQTVGYNLDPAGRTLETVSTGKPNNSTIVSYYAGPGNDPTWTLNPVSNEWRRNIVGIDGSLAAIQNNGETPELQLTNLHGDIVAKAYLSETATELAAKADTSEFGVPTVSAPAKYAWLGASELPTELPSGVVSMGVRSYVPQIGRFLQPDPVPGGSADAYSYTFGDPVNSSDPTGAYVESSYLNAFNDTQNREAVEREEAREAAARAAAEQAAREAAEAAALAGPQYEGEEEYWEEWWEEEGGWEYVGYQHGSESGNAEAHIEPAVLYQPLGEGASSGEGGGEGTSSDNEGARSFVGFGSTAPAPCKTGSEVPCTRGVSGAGNCEGPHGHPENCSEKGAKGSYHHYHGGGHGGGGAAERCTKGAVKGGVAGAAGGAVAGSMGGGAGAGPGAAAGAVAGAISGCLSEVL